MDSVKRKRGKKKFFACFRPVAIDDEGSLKPDDPVIEFVSVEGDEKMVLPKILTSLSEENLKLYSDGGGGRRMEKSRRSFSRILKAALFKASLVKKVCRRKARQNSSPTKSNSKSERSKNVSNEQHEKPKLKESSYAEDHRIDSTRWPSLNYSSSVTASTSMCSSRASSVTTNSRSSSQWKGLFLENSESKQADRAISIERERGGYSSNVGLCLLIVSLLVLIVWGKVCAILCTSTWFFLVPRGIRKVGSPVNVVDLPEIDSESEGYKKRVIMEGLLQRNRSRVIPQVR
ncbi:hypothetical protein CEY00_Acc13720 [Actinidia chinensis var. chinensis]|uniref:Uncharacterized protein n=1 Tax=Actinidia chinensis var. chinensis TaxID=1590841 RepID=A0A2R6QWT4_ACTCC|nr:hypothetical protein CEY00_Acc13720 [Actinidia chinensis var. chinensis]